MPETDPFAQAWQDALTGLEVSVADAEAMLAFAHSSDTAHRTPPTVRKFVPPTVPGPMPAHLLERAQALAARQAHVSEHLEAASKATARSAKVLGKVAATTHQDLPIFLDVNG